MKIKKKDGWSIDLRKMAKIHPEWHARNLLFEKNIKFYLSDFKNTLKIYEAQTIRVLM